MLTIKRQIESENERYGAFAESETYSDVASEREVNDDLLLMRTYTDNKSDVSEPVEAAPAPATYEKTENVVRTAPVNAPVSRRSDVKMHDIIRREQPEEEIERDVKPITREKKLTASAKRAIFVYLSVVLALVIAVIITGACISGVSSDITELESTIQTQEETILHQSQELAALDDVKAITKKAEELGMVKAEDGENRGYDKLEVGDDTEDKSGVFDSVRDWLNTVFGG